VAKGVARDLFRYAGCACGGVHGFADHRLVEVVATLDS
jgi:hypothetical protein